MTPEVLINLTAICDNFTAMAHSAKTGHDAALPAAVVKCNAYGLGLIPVATALAERAGCDAFFVAYPSEGKALRTAIEAAPIYVFHGVDRDSVPIYRRHGLTPVLNSPDQARLWAGVAPGAPAALHIDTGMNRLGVRPDDLAGLANMPGLMIDLVISHFADSEDPATAGNRAQARAFHDAAQHHFPTARRSLAASATALASPGDALDLVRLGVGLYGVAPLAHPDARIKPVATLIGKILATGRVAPGESVGYGRTFVAARDTRIATIGVGYGDGFPRTGSGKARAFVGGAPCPVIGRISMDLMVVDVTDAPQPVQPGDDAELFGPTLSIDDQAAACGTIGYELLTGLGPRVVRRYL